MRYLTLLRRPNSTVDAAVLHKDVMALFDPDLREPARLTAGVLFRAENNGQAVLISSVVPPVSHPHQPARDNWDSGTRIRFTVTVNAVTRRRDNGKVTEYQVADVASWASAKLAGLTGIDIDDVSSDRYRLRDGVLNLHTLSGTATVASPMALAGALTAGVGRAKAYGAGLLLVSPA